MSTEKIDKKICPSCQSKKSRKSKQCKKCDSKSRMINPNVDRREYARNWTIKKKYGITPEDFFAYWSANYGRCYICNKNMVYPEYRQGQGLDVVAIDHCHITNKMRGLLCNGCNKGLGLFKDNKEILANAIRYLSHVAG